jgi:hypothetical protein
MARASLACWLSAAALGVLWSGVAEASSADAEADRAALASLLPRPARALCVPGRSGAPQCLVQVVTTESGVDIVDSSPRGLSPQDLRSAYALPASGGHGKIVAAILPPYDYPNAELDLTVYRQQFGLPSCASIGGACFRKIDQEGGTNYPSSAPCAGGATASALNVQILSATCPDCQLLLVEPRTASDDDIGAAMATAIRLGAIAISASYSEAEAREDLEEEAIFGGHHGTLITVPGGEAYPATSAGTIAVGGTTLARSASARGWAESAWSAGGCSAMIAKPSWQTDRGCATRSSNDLSAVADPSTGVAVYCTDPTGGGWRQVGGSIVPAPLIAGAFAVVGLANGSFSPSWVWAHGSSFFDVTASGGLARVGCSPSFLCQAGSGYDAPTGWGTPNGKLLAATVGVGSPSGDPSPGAPLASGATAGCGCTLVRGGAGGWVALFATGALVRAWRRRRRA